MLFAEEINIYSLVTTYWYCIADEEQTLQLMCTFI